MESLHGRKVMVDSALALPRLQQQSNTFPTSHGIMPKSVFRRNGRSFWKNMACHCRMIDKPSLAGLSSITHANPAVPAGLFSFAHVRADYTVEMMHIPRYSRCSG